MVFENTSTVPPETGPKLDLGGLELLLDHALTTDSTVYAFEGRLGGSGAELYCNGGSLQIQNGQSGLVEEVFLSGDGRFAQHLTLQPDNDTPMMVALCDGLGTVVATTRCLVRHRSQSTSGHPPLATVQRDFAIEVVTKARQRRKQILAPAGVRLPGKFTCVGRTIDQSGRVVVPLWEGTRLIREIVVGEIDPRMPVGAVVEIELQLAVDLAATVRVLVRQAGRGEIVQIAAPASPSQPTPTQVADVLGRIEALLPEFSGEIGSDLQQNFVSRRHLLQTAPDGDLAAACFDELVDLREQMEIARLQVAYPPLPRVMQLVKHCLYEAANLADRSGRDREPLFAQIYAHEQVAEQAHAEKNAGRYRAAYDHLRVLAATLAEGTAASRQAATAHDVSDALKDFKAYLATVLAIAQLKGQADAVSKLQAWAGQWDGWSERGKHEPAVVAREVQAAHADLANLEEVLCVGRNRRAGNIEGMLEGSGGA